MTNRISIIFVLVSMSSVVTAAPLRIMALGDSITHGVDGASPTSDATRGGYRPFLNEYLNNGSIQYEWIGRGADGPPQARRHEGSNGFTIRQIDTLVIDSSFAEVGLPDIVLLMIGTNDAWNAPAYNDPLTTRERMLINLRNLLFHIHDRAPDARIVVSTIPPLGFPDPVIDAARETYNNGLPDLMNELQGHNFNIGMVNAGGRVPPELLPDLIHPSDAGYKLIADGFGDAFLLPATPEPAVCLPLAALLVLGRRRRN